MLRAVIFDFDGVITDSEILHFRSFNAAIAPFGVQVDKKEYYSTYLGLSDADTFKRAGEVGLVDVGEGRMEQLLSAKQRTFKELAAREGEIIEGVRDFVGMLRENGVAMAICSGSLLAEINLILEGASLRDYFDVVVSAEQVKHGKPHPEGFLLALEKLNEKTNQAVRPGDCVAIEDSYLGIEAAKSAGMHAAAITNSYGAAQLGSADRIVNDISELNLEQLQALSDS